MAAFTGNLFRGLDPDPFKVTDPIAMVQTNRMRAAWRVFVAGKDVTEQLDPHLILARVTDKSNTAECELELDDRDGTLPIPPLGSPIRVYVGWKNEESALAFDGKVWDIEYSAQRGQGGGRRMFVHGSGTDHMTTQLKTPMQEHTGDGAEPGQKEGQMIPFQEHISKVFGNGGGSMKVHPQLGGLKRDYWAQNAESAIQHAQNFADEFGGLLKIFGGNQGEMTVPGQTVDGIPSQTVVAEWGANLISCRVRPMASNMVWGSGQQQHYDTQIANWMKTLSQSGLQSPASQGQASWLSHGAAATQSASGQQSEGTASNAGYIGYGRVVMNGEPIAAFNRYVLLLGVRPGVDGLYWIAVCEHLWSRPSGFITTLEVISTGTAKAQVNILSGLLNPDFKPSAPEIPSTAEIRQQLAVTR